MQYQNPSYYPQYQPQINPYMQRMENLQQFQQAIQPMQQPTIPMVTQMQGANQFSALGKMVESIDIVKSTDIPMDGSMYYFPKADGTEVYGKAWLPNGQTRILTFKPINEDDTNKVSSKTEKSKIDDIEVFLKGIQDDIKTINEKIDKISKPTRAKKGDNEDEKSD